MQLTRIGNENIDYFRHLCPDELLFDEDLVRIGVIDDHREAANVCVARVVDNMTDILWLYTDPDKRELGIATYLMAALSVISENLGLDGIVANFMSQTEGMDDFLTESGFMVTPDSDFYSVPISDILYSRQMDKISESSGDPENTFLLSDQEGQIILNSLLRSKTMDPMILEGVSSDLSVLYRDPEEKNITAIFVTESGYHDLYVNYLLSNGSVRGICEVINVLGRQLISLNRTDGNLIFSDRSGRAITLVESLTENEREVYEMRGRMQAAAFFA